MAPAEVRPRTPLRKLGLTLDPDDFTDARAVAVIARITRGNFRLLDRLLYPKSCGSTSSTPITSDVVEAASSTLVMGTS